MRVVQSDAYLTSGVSYAYKAHRDTWYAHPKVLVNYWVPVFDCVGDNVMSMWSGYWDRPVRNSSSGFDYDRWVSEQRFKAASNIGVEESAAPAAVRGDRCRRCEMRIAGNAGDIMLFSTCHLHSTAPNVSGVTRFSYDLRTLDIDDLVEGRGPAQSRRSTRPARPSATSCGWPISRRCDCRRTPRTDGLTFWCAVQVRRMKPCELKKNPPGVTSAVRAPVT